MPRLAIVNMVIGFWVIFFAAASGSFIAFDLTEGFLKDQQLLNTWRSTLLQSSHGHTNMFAMIHILFGLTLPYGRLELKWQILQTIGLSAGTLAMGPGMMWRAYLGPAESLDLTGVLVGVGLSMALISVLSHASLLSYKLLKS